MINNIFWAIVMKLNIVYLKYRKTNYEKLAIFIDMVIYLLRKLKGLPRKLVNQ